MSKRGRTRSPGAKAGVTQPSPVPAGPVPLHEALDIAQRHWEAGQPAQAEAICNRILAVQSGNPGALHLLGIMAHAVGKGDLAIDLLTRATAAPGVPAVYFANLAEMCRQRHRLAEGEAAGRKAVERDARNPSAWNNLGIILQERDRLEEALTCLRRAVALHPDFAEAHNNLANTFKKLGDFAAAETEYAAALKLRPGYAEAYANLALTLDAQGRYPEALAAVERAVQLNPQAVDPYVTASSVCRSVGRKGDALAWAQKALPVAGADPGKLSAALIAVASSLRGLERLQDALDACQRALAAKPDDGEAVSEMGQVLQQLGRTEQAAAAFRRAIDLLPKPASARNNLAALLMEVGDKAGAEAEYRAVLAADPTFAPAWFNMADSKTFSADDPDVAAMEALLSRQPAPPYNDRMILHFALGKAYDDQGAAERAMRHLEAGNRMKRATVSYDGAATSAWMKRIAQTFTPDLFARLAGAGDASAVPVLVIGMPRSGTSLVEQILASHPAVHGAGELRAVYDIANNIRGADDAVLAFPGYMNILAPAAVAQMGAAYLNRVRPLAPQAERIVDKMPANFLHAGLIHLMLPNARIIHCRRNPVDTCLSCYSKLFANDQPFTYDQAELGRFYRDYEDLCAHWHQVIPATSLTEVRYEDVVEDLEGQARRLIAFCGLEWDDACLDFHRTRRPVRTASMNQVRKPIYASSVERWRRYEAHLGPLLAALGPLHR